MFKKTNTVDAVLATFIKTITALTAVRDAHIDDAAALHNQAAEARTRAQAASHEAKRADAILTKLNALVS